jgi:WD40 repeat protein
MALGFLLAALVLPGWLLVFSGMLPARPRTTLRPRVDCRFLRFSPDSKSMVTAGDEGFYSSGPLQVWDVDSGKELLSVAEKWGEIETIAFSPDGKLLAAHQKEGELKLWDIHAGQEVFSLGPFTRFGNWVNFRFSPDGKLLLVQDYRRGWPKDDVTFFDIATKQERGTVEAYFWALEFTDKGQGLIAWHRREGGKIVKMERWRLGEGQPLLCLVGNCDLAVDDLALSPDGETLATANNPPNDGHPSEIALRELETGAVRLRFPTDYRGKHVQSLSFSPDGRVLLAHTAGGTQLSWKTETRLWDVSRAEASELAAFAETPIFSPDGKWLAVPVMDGADLYDGVLIRKTAVLVQPGDEGPGRFGSYNGHISYPTVEFSPDSRLVAVASLSNYKEQTPILEWFSKNIYRLPTDSGGRIVRVWNVKTGQEHASFRECWRANFSPDGKTIATLRHDGRVELWEVPVRGPVWMVIGLSLLTWLASAGCFLGSARWLQKRKDKVLAGDKRVAAGAPFQERRPPDGRTGTDDAAPGNELV